MKTTRKEFFETKRKLIEKEKYEEEKRALEKKLLISTIQNLKAVSVWTTIQIIIKIVKEIKELLR